MAIFRLIRSWRQPSPRTRGLNLRQLVVLQLSVFAVMLALYVASAAFGRGREMMPMIVGFGAAWIAVIRVYVSLYVP